jgi:molybdate-binding protein/DNA-binding XRE family transcriptional regulator
MDVRNTLAELRSKRGFSAAQLAAAVGVSRQTIYAMEAGSYVPNTLVALKLAQVLEVKVDGIFRLDKKAQPAPTAEVELLPWTPPGWTARPGQPLHLCRVGSRLVAVPAEPGARGLPAADGVVSEAAQSSSRIKVQFLGEDYKTEKRLLLAGCDPSAPVLGRHLQRQGVGLVVAYENSGPSLEWLKRGLIHVAGLTYSDDGGTMLRRKLGRQPLEMVRYAAWEEGIVIAPGNPKAIKGVADLARAEVSMVNREPGASCRLLLDSQLKNAGISLKSVKGYERIAFGDLPAARQVVQGEVDCCLGTRAAARALGLDFVPLASQAYALVWQKSHARVPEVDTLLEILGQVSFRHELETVWAYEVKAIGEHLDTSPRRS